MPIGVVIGPFSATPFAFTDASVSSGSGVPASSITSTPAWRTSHSSSTPVASRTRRVASVSSGPVPSPGMRVTRWAIGGADRTYPADRDSLARTTIANIPEGARCRGRVSVSTGPTRDPRSGSVPADERGRGLQARARRRRRGRDGDRRARPRRWRAPVPRRRHRGARRPLSVRAASGGCSSTTTSTRSCRSRSRTSRPVSRATHRPISRPRPRASRDTGGSASSTRSRTSRRARTSAGCPSQMMGIVARSARLADGDERSDPRRGRPPRPHRRREVPPAVAGRGRSATREGDRHVLDLHGRARPERIDVHRARRRPRRARTAARRCPLPSARSPARCTAARPRT